jgi:hypothetical protein
MTPEQLLAHADCVRAVVLGPSRTSTPPASAFRRNLAGRKAWLDQAEKTLDSGSFGLTTARDTDRGSVARPGRRAGGGASAGD